MDRIPSLVGRGLDPSCIGYFHEPDESTVKDEESDLLIVVVE
jgi:hypothetical protein